MASHNNTVAGHPATAVATAANSATRNRAPSVYSPLELIFESNTSRPPQLHCAFFCCLGAFFVLLIFVFSLHFFLKPQLPEFQLDSAALSKLNLTQSNLTATWRFTLSVKNANRKLRFKYDRFLVSVLYGDDLALATTQLPPFFQDRRILATVDFQLHAASEYVGADVVKAISQEKSHGSVDFALRIFAWVRFGSNTSKMGKNLIRVYCYPITIEFSGINGTATSGSSSESKKCHVYM